MKPFFPASLLLAGMAWLLPLPNALAQSYCASDGQPRPAQLTERFINADCDSCWADPATPQAAAGQLALDWLALVETLAAGTGGSPVERNLVRNLLQPT